MKACNPRYAAYAASHKLTPEAMLEHDRGRFPGGHMAGFMIWIREHWRAFDQERGYDHRTHSDMRPDADHDAFSTWLLARYPVTEDRSSVTMRATLPGDAHRK